MLKLLTIIASTRPGRAGLPVAEWFQTVAKAHGQFELEVADLKTINLPMLDEPNHPTKQQYEHEHTRAWSKTVSAADAFVIVTPEYNYGSPPALINALNYVYKEWNYKPAGMVSYGGISGGTRSAQMSKLVLTTLKVVPLFEQVTIPFVANQIKDGAFVATEQNAKAAAGMLTELHKWAVALKPMRG